MFVNYPDLLDNLPIELLGVDTLPIQEGRDINELKKADYLALGPIQMDKFLQFQPLI